LAWCMRSCCASRPSCCPSRRRCSAEGIERLTRLTGFEAGCERSCAPAIGWLAA
jgi:hypothetical protein